MLDQGGDVVIEPAGSAIRNANAGSGRPALGTRARWQAHGDGTAQVSGRIRIDELEALLGTDLPAGDRDTAGGLLCALHGHVPGAGVTATCRGHTLRAERVWAPE